MDAHSLFKIGLVTLYAVGMIGTLFLIDKPRPPMSGMTVAINSMLNTIILIGLIKWL